MWQTPVSTVSPVELDALRFELGARRRDVRHPKGDAGRAGRERLADVRRVEHVQSHLAELELHVVLALRLDRAARAPRA